MDYYYKEFEKLQKEFHDVMNDYPLFKETIDDLEEKDIKELNELLEKHDEYYFKKAITKLKDLIIYIKETSTTIKTSYEKFDDLAKKWEKVRIVNVSEEELNDINRKVKKANELIKSHNIKDLKEANKIMELLIKENE
jgi:hypothetical protein